MSYQLPFNQNVDAMTEQLRRFDSWVGAGLAVAIFASIFSAFITYKRASLTTAIKDEQRYLAAARTIPAEIRASLIDGLRVCKPARIVIANNTGVQPEADRFADQLEALFREAGCDKVFRLRTAAAERETRLLAERAEFPAEQAAVADMLNRLRYKWRDERGKHEGAYNGEINISVGSHVRAE